MPMIRRATIVKQVGDPWTPTDANKAQQVSKDVEINVDVEHYVRTIPGTHRQPAAAAAAIVRWTGSAYTVSARRGLDASFGVGGVQRISAGRLAVRLDFDAANAYSWIAVVTPFAHNHPVSFVHGFDVGGLAKTTRQTVILIGEYQGPAEGFVPIDYSFVLEVFGNRA